MPRRRWLLAPVIGGALGLLAFAGTPSGSGPSGAAAAARTPAAPQSSTPSTRASSAPSPWAALPSSRQIDLGAVPTLAEALPTIEQFVERARGHRFLHEVDVTPLARAAFLARLHFAEGSDGTADSALGATFTALRLVRPGTDLGAARRADLDAAVGGFYDNRTGRLYVRSRRMTPLTQVIVAHELTHALDDQWFDLRRIRSNVSNGDQALAVLSLLEGDARWVEDRFRAALSPRRRAEADAEGAKAYGGPPGDVPGALLAMGDFPYEVGEQFVTEVRRHGGSAAVDRAFRRPPTTTLQIMDPVEVFVDQRDDGERVQPPDYIGQRLDSDRLGAFGLALTLADGHPQRLFANSAPVFWEGDSYVTYRNGSDVCLRDRLQVDAAGDRVHVVKALQRWSRAHAGSSVVTEGRRGLLFTTCAGPL